MADDGGNSDGGQVPPRSTRAKPKPRFHNEDLVTMINDLKMKRDAVGKEIEIESAKRDDIQTKIDEEKKRLQHCECRLKRLQQSNEAYARMVNEAEAAYMKIQESSETLLHVLKRESKSIQKDLAGHI
jgi:Sjoegren syndrome nuclear autoantigen 1